MTSSAFVESPTVADTHLVANALSGERHAFESIVRRYQRLVCSVAYSAVGDVRMSEDIAQETFLAAWKALPRLKEPEKLRGWLCGITRRLSLNRRRQARTEPAAGADLLHESDADAASSAESPAETAERHDDAALVWQALASIPELYREPLVLYYRENHSVEQVAKALDLTETATKQRLARGREHLKAEVTSLVEGALRASAPGAGFTQMVMATLPVSALSAKTAAGGSMLAKSFGGFALLGGVFTGIAAGYAGSYLGYRQTAKAARSDEERTILRGMFLTNIVGMSALLLSVCAFIYIDRHTRIPTWIELTIVPATLLLYFGVVGLLLLRASRKISRLKNNGIPFAVSSVAEYRSQTELWGQPLVHIRFGDAASAALRPVRAWIAIGGVAYGRLFAYGGIAVAPIAAGGIAIGGLAVGGLSMALLAIGGCAAGGLALGGQALGWVAVAGSAIGYRAAYGGIALARDFAVAPTAAAAHANDAAALAYFHNGILGIVSSHLQDVAWIGLIGLVPIGLWWWAERRKQPSST